MKIACERATVRETTYDLLRRLDLRVIFGNPGSTEEPFLKEFPADFQYVLALQEASAIAMADGYAQSTGKPALVNLHTAAGIGNGMGTLMTAYQNKTPLIVLAGQQTREMLIGEPFLTNRDETMMPRPWVKWSYQPTRPQDVPAAIMRAYAMALQPPAGPVFLSIPLDDWDKPIESSPVSKTFSRRTAPDPERVENFAARVNASANPAIIYGGDIDRSDAWNEAIELAERLKCPVFAAPLAERGVFPETHKQFQGMLPPAIGPLSERLTGFDLVVVVGAPVFRYYPYVGGEFLKAGTELLHITDDPNEASTAVVGDSLLSDSKLALQALLQHVTARTTSTYADRKAVRVLDDKSAGSRISAEQLFEVLSESRPEDAIVLQESPSNFRQFAKWWPTVHPHSYFTCASGGLGWNGPAACGHAIAEKEKPYPRPVIAFIGDGAMQYSIQSLYTAAQLKLKVVYIIPCNDEYAVLKSFAELEETPGVPGLDLRGLDISLLAQGYGCNAIKATDIPSLKAAFEESLKYNGPTVITVPIEPGFKRLI